MRYVLVGILGVFVGSIGGMVTMALCALSKDVEISLEDPVKEQDKQED